MDTGSIDRRVRVASTLGDALWFERMEGSDGLSCSGEYRLALLSRRGDIVAEELLGKPLSIVVELPSGGRREFNGLAASFSLLPPKGRLHRYQIVLRPWTWMLTRRRDSRIFQGLTTQQILQAVFARHSAADFRFELASSHAPRPYCVQYRETDFHFMSRLLEEDGIHYFFEHAAGRHTLVIADGSVSHRRVAGYEQVSFLEPELMLGMQVEGLQGWSSTAEIQPVRQVLRDYDFEKPRADLQVGAEPIHPARHVHADELESYDHPGGYRERADGEVIARIRAEAMRVQHETFHGEGNAGGLAPGRLFGLQSHPRPDQNRDYLVTAARYCLQESAREAGDPVGQWLALEIEAIAAGQEYRPPRLAAKPLVQGPQTAVVTGPAGDEIHTDRYGRVKVQFHWDRQGLRDQHSSCWIRVAHPWAGQNWGMVAIPRVGQEVVVEFLEGDPDRPLITGSVYNHDQMPPHELPRHMTRSGIRSRSTPGGNGSSSNEIRFEDRRGEEELRLHAERDQVLHTRRDRVEWIGHESHLIVRQDMLAQFDADHHLSVCGDQNIELGGSHSFHVGQDWQGRIGLRMAAEAGEEIHLKAGSRLVLEAGAQLTLKVGGSFIEIGPGGVTISGSSLSFNDGAGSPGSGSGARPEKPRAPRSAAAVDGQTSQSAVPPCHGSPPSSQAHAIRQARASASAFVAHCPEESPA
ncbi:MAG: hypothetical protein RLZZ555_548 [Pseudomonadota bacterium]|jgi:type VI secretion system secreted protein VgrG